MRALLLTLGLIATPLSAAEQCVWPFRTAPADVAARMRADLGDTLKAVCPAQELVAVSFLLPVGKSPRRIAVDAPGCKAAAPAIARWIKARPSSEFMAYDQPQNVAFKIAMRFSA